MPVRGLDVDTKEGTNFGVHMRPVRLVALTAHMNSTSPLPSCTAFYKFYTLLILVEKWDREKHSMIVFALFCPLHVTLIHGRL